MTGALFSNTKAEREGTVTIAVHAFNFCEQLEEVQLPESLRVIGGMAFSYCSSLQSITLSEGRWTYQIMAQWTDESREYHGWAQYNICIEKK